MCFGGFFRVANSRKRKRNWIAWDQHHPIAPQLLNHHTLSHVNWLIKLLISHKFRRYCGKDKMKVRAINFILSCFFFRLTWCVNIGKSGIITTDINWYEWIPIDQPNLLFEFVLNVEFPTSASCPIVHLRQNHTNQCVEPNCCFDSTSVQELQAVYKTKYFQLYQEWYSRTKQFCHLSCGIRSSCVPSQYKRIKLRSKDPLVGFWIPVWWEE